MGRFRRLSGKEICKILSEHGFVKARQKGSHMIMVKPFIDESITVAVSDHKEIAIGTLAGIIRQSGIPRSEFE